MDNNTEDDDNDPWLDQYLAGAKRREERANATGWGCAIALGLMILMVVLLVSAGTHR